MLGVVRAPSKESQIRKYDDSGVIAWQFVDRNDTVDFVRVVGPPTRLIAEVRAAGKRVGTVETKLDGSGVPQSSRLIVPSVPARLDITFSSNLKAKPFAPDTWTPPER